MLIAIISAFICVLTRAILNVCDRQIFKKDNSDFLKSVVYNAVFPFLVAFGVGYIFGEQNRYFFTFLMQPGVILSALGAQLAATIFSYCFRRMTVKSVVVSSKMADLVIPLMIFLVTSEFKVADYCFSCLSTLIFVPILFMIIRNKSDTYILGSLALVGVLIFQASTNSYFAMHKYADTWPKFLSMMSCILLWRTVFIVIPLLIQWLQKLRNNTPDSPKEVDYKTLILRAFLAFVSQASFFYSITRLSGNIAWPVLNSTPLVACFTAHLFLKEGVGKTELAVLGAFLILSSFYVFMHWSFS